MIYRQLFIRLLKGRDFKGTLEIIFNDKKYSFGSGPKVSMRVKSGFFRRVILYGDIGLGESYFNGDLETDDLRALLMWFLDNIDELPGFPKSKDYFSFEIAKFSAAISHMFRKNTKKGSRKNIKHHYDVSNEFYQLWLDETMTYSCALFEKGMTLKQAQENKYRHICEKISLKRSDHLLEIGSGWGGFAIYAAKNYGCKITTVTISKEQYKLAKELIKQAGLENKIDLQFKDYRDIRGKYDKIVSIEMMEALGYNYVPKFIKKCSNLLKNNGKICYQVITFPDDHFKSYLRSQNYIKKHIFPGSELLSIVQIREVARKNSLHVEDIEEIGRHYATTLACWDKNFIKKKKEILSMGFDEKFYKKWLYYFIYCEVGFATDYIGNSQIIINK